MFHTGKQYFTAYSYMIKATSVIIVHWWCVSLSPWYSRFFECTSWRQQWRWRAVTREPVGPFGGGCGQFPRGRQGCACWAYRPSAKGSSSEAGENRIHGGPYQATGGRDPQKDQVSGMDQHGGSRKREMTQLLASLPQLKQMFWNLFDCCVLKQYLWIKVWNWQQSQCKCTKVSDTVFQALWLLFNR